MGEGDAVAAMHTHTHTLHFALGIGTRVIAHNITHSLTLHLSRSTPPFLFPSSSASDGQNGWLADTDTRSNHSTSTAEEERGREPLRQCQQTTMSDHASREEVARRVEAKLKAAREKGEFGRNRDTEQKILSIARNTCGEYLE